MRNASISLLANVRLAKTQCEIDGRSFSISPGAWAIYIPTLQLKLLHAMNDQVHCIHKSAPPRDRLFAGLPVSVKSTYSSEDWRHALSKSAFRRAAENFIAATRLHAAGIGPAVAGICVVQSFDAWYSKSASQTAGIFVDDLTKYRAKADTTAEEMIAAGVQPDRILSCTRQQINGYVSDLNSVVGVMPINADAEIEQLVQQLQATTLASNANSVSLPREPDLKPSFKGWGFTKQNRLS